MPGLAAALLEPEFPQTLTGREFVAEIDDLERRDRLAEAVLEPETLRQLEEARVRRHRDAASAWEQAFLEHREHPTFALQDDVWTRSLGFSCRCSGRCKQKRVQLAALRLASPHLRAALTEQRRIVVPQRVQGRRLAMHLSKDERRALERAKVLLHQHLTREQRWSLKGTGAFRVQGQDGRTYEIPSLGLIQIIEDGNRRANVAYCIRPTQRLPLYDVMLAQKLLIETNTALFLEIAHAHG